MYFPNSCSACIIEMVIIFQRLFFFGKTPDTPLKTKFFPKYFYTYLEKNFLYFLKKIKKIKKFVGKNDILQIKRNSYQLPEETYTWGIFIFPYFVIFFILNWPLFFIFWKIVLSSTTILFSFSSSERTWFFSQAFMWKLFFVFLVIINWWVFRHSDR